VHDPARAGWAVFRATARFHHPAHAAEWTDPEMDAAFEDVCALVLRGLGPPVVQCDPAASGPVTSRAPHDQM
jgi:hypothetical protein